ncbi:MAG: LPS export ABC transporter permease LptG [Calditrichaeota bacterium]|nr:MAG: LPS export ABC transporter permease LptG [Calditrichota bacterium]MBL1207490.1 LPS export ABC transporter permease LptG [Calditrichota bacterium]NOG47322.1 LPS export ABC transporter permease LptG [Calditrichota bacterium]
MKKLHQYLLKKFIVNLFVAISGWIIIFIIINMIEKLSVFIDNDASLQQFFLFYVYFIPYIISLTLPIAMLLAALFAVSNLAQHNEIVAQLSSGISLYKILTPLFITAFFISILAGIFNEYVVPVANQNRAELMSYEIKDNPRNRGKFRNNIYLQDSDSRKMYVKYYNGKKNVATEVSLQTFSGSVLVERIDAKKMSWIDSSWVLTDASLRRFSNDQEQIFKMADTTISDSRIKPKNLMRFKKKPEEMSYAELNTFIKELKEIGANPRKWLVERHLKIALPFANFIVVLIGAPFASRKRRGGTGLSFGLSLLISFSFFIIIRFGQVLGHQGTLEPLLAAWLGNLIFLSLGLYTLFTVKK